MPATHRLRVKLNAGAWQTGGVTAALGDTVALSPDNTVGVTSYRYEIFDYPPGFACPAGWSTDANSVYYSTAATPPDFALDAVEWGKYALRLTVNGGVSEVIVGKSTRVQADPLLIDEATAISVASTSGVRGLMQRETTQFADRDWTAEYNADMRVMAAAVADVSNSSLINQLRARIPDLTAGQVVYLKGHTTENDGGEGSFICYSGGSYTDDDGTVLVEDGYGQTDTKCLKRVFSGALDVRWFGAVGDGQEDGSGTDDTTAIQRAIDAAVLRPRWVQLPPRPAGYGYKVTTTLDIPTGIRFHGGNKASTHGTYTSTIYWAPASPSSSDACLLCHADSGLAGWDVGYLLLFQCATVDANGAGTAIRVEQTDEAIRPSWMHFHHMLIDAFDADPWTHGLYFDGNQPVAGDMIRDVWIDHVRVTGAAASGSGITLFNCANVNLRDVLLNNGSDLVIDGTGGGDGSRSIWLVDCTIADVVLDVAQDVYIRGGRFNTITETGNTQNCLYAPDYIDTDPRPLAGVSTYVRFPEYSSGIMQESRTGGFPGLSIGTGTPSTEPDRVTLGYYMADPVPRQVTQADKSWLIGFDDAFYDIPLIQRACKWSPPVEGGVLLWHRADLHAGRDHWDDLSGNRNNAAQATAANYVINARGAYGNFRDAIQGGTVPSLDYASAVSLGTVATLVVVASRPTLANAYLLSNSTGASGIIGNFTGNLIEWLNGADRYTLADNPSGMHCYVVTQTNGGALKGYLDGTEVFSQTATVALPSLKYLLNTTGNVNGWNGDVAEIMAFGHIVSDFADLNAYVEAFHGIAMA